MNMQLNTFVTPNSQKQALSIITNHELKKSEASEIRSIIDTIQQDDYLSVYLDTKQVIEIDLSAINEIIYTHAKLTEMAINFIVVYRRDSVMEKWLFTSGINRFIQTALLPQSI